MPRRGPADDVLNCVVSVLVSCVPPPLGHSAGGRGPTLEEQLQRLEGRQYTEAYTLQDLADFCSAGIDGVRHALKQLEQVGAVRHLPGGRYTMSVSEARRQIQALHNRREPEL